MSKWAHSSKQVSAKKQDERAAAVNIIKSLHYLAVEARRSNLDIPAHIINNARADIIHWAANHAANDAEYKNLLSQVTNDSGLLIAMDFISRYAGIDDHKLRQDIFDLLSEHITFSAGGSTPHVTRGAP